MIAIELQLAYGFITNYMRMIQRLHNLHYECSALHNAKKPILSKVGLVMQMSRKKEEFDRQNMKN